MDIQNKDGHPKNSLKNIFIFYLSDKSTGLGIEILVFGSNGGYMSPSVLKSVFSMKSISISSESESGFSNVLPGLTTSATIFSSGRKV